MREDTKDKVFLFLQGPLSSYYSDIAQALIDAGADVLKIHFCGNDIMDWRHKGAIRFQGTLSDWPAFLEEIVQSRNVTHLVMHADRRPYHKPAGPLARRQGVKVFVTELGYLRPDWMTLEPDGVSTLSRFTNDPAIVRQAADRAKARFRAESVYQDNAWSIISQEARFTFFNALFSRKFPNYQTHRSGSQWRVYHGWISAKVRNLLQSKKDRHKPLTDKSFFVMALQLAGDLQLRDHSPFQTVEAGIDYVLSSFRDHAPPDAELILKFHPHEFNRKSLTLALETIAKVKGISSRIKIVGNIPIRLLCKDAAGFVTINSSAGFEALACGCPVFTIMPTIYDMTGLTFQGRLDRFWNEGLSPDATLLEALCGLLAHSIQLRGTLYNHAGRQAAAQASAQKLLDDAWLSNEYLHATPPRLVKAHAMDVHYDDNYTNDR